MKRQWTTDELIDEWTLRPEDFDLLGRKAGAGRLGFAALLAFFHHEGRFPKQRHEIPSAVVSHLAKQVAVDPHEFLHYSWSGRTIEAHRAQIRAVFGFREMGAEDVASLAAWLVERVLPREHREARVLEDVLGECRVRGLEPPTTDRLMRLIRSAARMFEENLYARTLARLSAHTRAALDALIEHDIEHDDVSPTRKESGGSADRDRDGNGDGDGGAEAGANDGWPGAVTGDPPVEREDEREDEGDAAWDVESLLDVGDVGDVGDSGVNNPHAAGPAGALAPAPQAAPAPLLQTSVWLAHAQRGRGIKAPHEMSHVDLRADPGPTGLASVLAEVNKLLRLRALDLSEDLFAELSPRVLQRFRDRAAVEAPSLLRRHPEAIRITLLAALCWARTREVTDGLVTLFIALIQRMSRQAERRVEREIIEDYRRVAGKTGILFRVAEAAVAHPEGIVREVIFPAVGGERLLTELVKEYRASGPRYREHVQLVMKRSFSTYYRRMLPPLLDVLEFRSNNAAHQPLIRALALIREYARGGPTYYPADEPIPLEGIVRSMWRDLVVEEGPAGDLRVVRVHYELCALQALRDAVRSKEVWVVGARRFRNPEEDLPSDFEAQRAAYYTALRKPTDPAAFIAGLRTEMEAALTRLNTSVAHGRAKGVKILGRGGGWIQVSPLAPLPDPPLLGRLKAEVVARWPMTGLLDVLKETALRTRFTEVFTSVAAREVLDPETLYKRVLLCLFATGTNTGLKRLAGADPGTTYSDLRYVRSRYIAREQVRAAIARVANAIFRARRAEVWGEATTACASDSKKFGSWDQNLMTEWSARHFGRGVMVYWHVETKSVCVYSQLKTISSSEVAAMIEGVLRHCTDMTVEKNYVDTHGQSEVGFAFCHLLGFRLMPRLKQIGLQRLYRPAAGQPHDYTALQPVLTRPIDWALIAQQYDQMVKYATALRLGTAETEAILRRFTRANVQHPTYRALQELGKAVKTIFLCEYLASEALRREIHDALNVIENWNSANSFIFYGKGGEIATNRTDEQELAVLCLHLLQIALVYVNTLMVQHVLRDRAWVRRLGPEDRRALTPLFYVHVNPYGRFSLDLNERLPGLPGLPDRRIG